MPTRDTLVTELLRFEDGVIVMSMSPQAFLCTASWIRAHLQFMRATAGCDGTLTREDDALLRRLELAWFDAQCEVADRYGWGGVGASGTKE